MNSFGYSCIPENKIITSFKRFIAEKKKNGFPGGSGDSSFVEHTPSKETITYQAQIISSYYSLDDVKQDEFWMNMEQNKKVELSQLSGEDFYIRILQELTNYFGIQRNAIQLLEFLEKKVIYAYNECGYRIYLDQVLRWDEDQKVWIGRMTKDSPVPCRPTNGTGRGAGRGSGGGIGLATGLLGSEEEKWIVRWNTTPEVGEKLTMDEVEKWRLIESTGAMIPKVLSGFMILDFSVVVMERLYPLEIQDYNQKLVMSITSYIEKLIPIGVNNNLKPSNILKKIHPITKEVSYFVSDVALMTTQPDLYGYKRFTWSPFWSSQVMDLDTVTTVKNDLLELGYVLTWLSKLRDVNTEEEMIGLMNRIRIVEKPKEIMDWMNRVRAINEQEIEMKDFVDLKRLALAFPKFSVYESMVYDYCLEKE